MLALAIGIVAVIAITPYLPGLPFGAPGTRDFVQYWAALQALNAGANPYDGAVLHAIESRVGVPADQTVQMWNPPWLVVLLWPVLRTSFESSALGWFILQIIFLCAIAAMAPIALRRTGLSLLARGSLIISFYPVLDCLGLGQLSIFITFALFASLWFGSHGSYCAAGIAIAPLATKPHLFFLCTIPAVLWFKELDRSNKRRFVVGALLGLSASVGAAEYIWPHSISWWLESIIEPHMQPGTIPVTYWKTATLTTCVRMLCEAFMGTAPTWPLWVVPSVAFLTTSLIVLRNKGQLSWQIIAPATLCLSVVTSNYGWFFDQTLLLPVQLLILYQGIHSPSRSSRIVIIATTLGIQAVAFGLGSSLKTSSQFTFTWVPLAILAAYLFSQRRRGK